MLCASSSFAQEDIRSEIDKLILYEADWNKRLVPGFVISLIEADTIYHFGYGSLEDSTAQYRNFEIGSFTKRFTAEYLESLIALGKVDEKARIDKIIPHIDSTELHNLFELKQHITGLPKRPDFIGRTQREPRQPYEFYSKEKLLQDYLIAPKSDFFGYSHTNYALIELVLDNLLKNDFISGFNNFLQSSLNMNDSWIGNSRDSLLTQGYDRAARACDAMLFPSFAGSEGMRSNANDLSIFLQNEMKTIEQQTAGQMEYSFHSGIYFQYPWFRFKKKDHYFYTYAGRTAGHNCQVFVYPYTQTAVLILSNGHVGVNHLPLNVLRMMNENWKRKAKD